MSDIEKEGHILVCPCFGPEGAALTNDIQVRCLSYILKHINEITTLPADISLEIISIRWHHFGEAYPSLGIPAAKVAGSDAAMMTILSFKIGDQITEFIKRIGLYELVEISAGESMSWADVPIEPEVSANLPAD